MRAASYAHGATPRSETLYRCFYAVQFTPDVTGYVMGVIEALKGHRADVRWTSERNIHLTLRFLGEISAAQVAAAKEALAAARLAPFRLRARGLGAFPAMRAPRVFWAGVEGEHQGDTDRLLHAQQQTEHWARAVGLAPEGRRYVPHITLGRVGSAGAGLKALTDDVITRDCCSEFCTIGRLVLMRSVFGERGPEYSVIAAVPLAV